MTTSDHHTGLDIEEGILRGSGLKKTVGRVKILEALQEAGRPLTGGELCAVLGRDSMDPASIYRALTLFWERGIVHRIVGGDTVVRFAINRGEREHPHFVCRGCGKMDCLDDVSLPAITVPSGGYLVEERRLFLSGLCARCNIKR